MSPRQKSEAEILRDLMVVKKHFYADMPPVRGARRDSRIPDLEARLAALRARPGAAYSEGQKFNIRELEDQLDDARRAESKLRGAR